MLPISSAGTLVPSLQWNSSNMKLSVVIPVYNEERELQSEDDDSQRVIIIDIL